MPCTVSRLDTLAELGELYLEPGCGLKPLSEFEYNARSNEAQEAFRRSTRVTTVSRATVSRRHQASPSSSNQSNCTPYLVLHWLFLPMSPLFLRPCPLHSPQLYRVSTSFSASPRALFIEPQAVPDQKRPHRVSSFVVSVPSIQSGQCVLRSWFPLM